MADSAMNGNLNGQRPLPARLLGVGVRGARTVTRAAGIDRAVEVAAEEAIVAAVESEAVERALARVLEGPAVEEAVQGALGSDAVKRALLEALDSELVDEVWRRLLASEEAQQLVERIAEAPELRAAISAQGVGLIGDIGRTIGRAARHLDDTLERLARRILLRQPRQEPVDHAGVVSRVLAFAVDAAFVNLGFSALAAVAALIDSAITGNGHGVSSLALALGSAAWLTLGALYLVGFWCLAGQTPGMRFIRIRLDLEGKGLPFGRALSRLIGFGLGVLTFGIGFLGIVFNGRRRGWEDQLSDTDVVYEEDRSESAPWSRLEEPMAAVEPGPAA
ncbi:MAG TPA: RDD family protein [Solirubrobacterales bacterium]|nr:RDD family protein [Solirubrobacterales bacterium]